MSHHYEEQDDKSRMNPVDTSLVFANKPLTITEALAAQLESKVKEKIQRPKVRDEKFWMVWKNYGDGPKMKHVTEDEANREAERIAHEKTSEPVYVMEAVRVFQRASPPVERRELQ